MLSFEQFERATTRVTRAIALIGLTGLLLLASATVLDVLLRWIFNRPIVGLNDTHSLFTALVISSCFPLCIYKGGNITIRFMGSILGKRAKNILDVFGSLLTLIIFALMGWQLWRYADQLAQDGATTWILDWPISPWWRIVTVIIMVCVPVTIMTTIQFTKSALEKEQIQDQPASSSNQHEAEDK
jgi:TRAP-type C4-dicarboxylate transport system permease small subunit